jgi:hypothetical protein
LQVPFWLCRPKYAKGTQSTGFTKYLKSVGSFLGTDSVTDYT